MLVCLSFSLRFFSLASSGDRLPACPLARTVTPSHQHLCFPLYRPSHLRSLDAARPPFFLVVCCGLSSPPARIYPLPYYPPALPLCAREKEWRKTTVAWDGKSRRPSLHTANPSFFHRNHRLHRARSESPSAHGTRGECDWIKLELQRMIGQSFTRLRPFFFSSARSLARPRKYPRRTSV